jgi:hypothetical protein
MHSPNKNGYLLLFRGTDWHRELSPEEIQGVMSEWGQWFTRLKQEGKLLSGSPLEHEGYVVSGRNRSVADGPFAESKEAVGGYFYLTVEKIEEAVAIAQECPALPHGLTVEVRPVAPACPVERMLGGSSFIEHAMAS